MRYFYSFVIALLVGSAILSSCGHDTPTNKSVETSSIVIEESSSSEESSIEELSSIEEENSIEELVSVESSIESSISESSSAAAIVKKVTTKVTKKSDDTSLAETVEITKEEPVTTTSFYEANEEFFETAAPAQVIEASEDSSEVFEVITVERLTGEAPEDSVVEVQKELEVKEETSSQIEREFIVYKPSTHYVHSSTCHWVSDECYEITNTEGIEARICTECNPDIKIVKEYKEPTPTYGIDSYSRQLLAEIVWHEAGSNYISQYEKARVCAGVMNRVKDSRFPSTVYGVLTQAGQFQSYWPGCCTPTQACYNAVDYYFAYTNEFGCENSWWGDGRTNHFYYQ